MALKWLPDQEFNTTILTTVALWLELCIQERLRAKSHAN